MPLRFVNPAPTRAKRSRMPLALRKYWASKKRSHAVPRKRKSTTRLRRHRSLLTRPAGARSVSRAAKKSAARSTHKRKKPMKRLFGAAARSHAKKMARLHRRRKNPRRRRRGRRNPAAVAAAPAANPRRRRRRRMRNPSANPRRRRRHRRNPRKSTMRSMRRALHTLRAPARGRARAYKRRYRMASSGYGRRVRLRGATENPRRRRRRKARRNPARSRRRSRRRYRMNSGRRRSYRRRRRNPRYASVRSLRRARRTIRNRHMTNWARSFKRTYRMRSNPSVKGVFGAVVGLVKQAAPVMLAFYGSRMLTGKFLAKVPGLNRLPAAAQGPVMAVLVAGAAHVATKKVKFLGKYRGAIMLGTGLNLVDALFGAIAPASVKSMFGLSDIYDTGLSDYISVDDYVEVGNGPIDDDITLSDYVEIGLDQELGALQEDLGVEEELGAADGLSRAYLGGVAQSSMLQKIGTQPLLQAIPSRSFTKDIRQAGPGYDKASVLYGGVFAGGF